MKNPIRPLLIVASLSTLFAAPAIAEISVGDMLGTEDGAIQQRLEELGYVIEEIEREDGELEVEASLDGIEYELMLSPETGEVVEIEQEDD